jgi:hypothetical protein
MSKVYTINTGNKAQFLSEYAFLSGSRITGSLFGTASWAQSSSVANSASFAPIGPGTTNRIALFNSTNTVSSSLIAQSGDSIGIGTTSPGAKLDIKLGSDVDFFRIQRASATGRTQFVLADENANTIWRVGGTGPGVTTFAFFDGTQNALTLEQNGNVYFTPFGSVGIGTTSPTAKLHVTGSTGGVFEVDTANAATTLYVSASGNVGIGTSSPAQRLDVSGSIAIAGTAIVNTSRNLINLGSLSNDANTGFFNIIDSGKQIQLTDGTRDLRINSTFGGSNAAIGTVGSHDLNLFTANSFRVTIKSDGNVGIGTTNPGYKLDVYNPGNLAQFLSNDGTFNPRLQISGSSEGIHIYQTYSTVADSLVFGTGGAERMRIKGSNVGIGTAAPGSNRLQVQGNVSASSYTSSINNAVGFLGTSSWAVSASRASSSATVDVLSGGSTTGLGIYSGSFSGSFFGSLSGGGSGAGFPYSGSAVITGSLLISGSGLQVTGSTTTSGSILPAGDNMFDLGSSARRWANLYTGDLVLSNEGSSGNNVDGTTGNWTVQEGDAHLYIINNKSGKKYKLVLEEIE